MRAWIVGARGRAANGGVRYDPIFYTRVLDYEGNILLEEQQTSTVVLKETSAWILADMLRTNVKGDNGGTASYDNFTDKAFYKNATGHEYKGQPQAVGGKTGSSENESDEVFVGFTNYYVGAVWAGFDYYTYKNEKDPWKNMRYAHRVIWMRIMAAVHEDLPSKTTFARPSGIVSVNTCAMSGMIATSACGNDPTGSQIVTEWYAKGTEPKDRCDKHVGCVYCTESGLYPSADCTSVATSVRFQRTREQLDAIQEALEYFKAENRKKYNAALAAKTPETFDYSKIEDWPYMAPWCYDILCAKADTLQRVWTMGGSSCQLVDIGMNWFEGADEVGEDGAGPVYQFDNSNRMVCPYDSLEALLADHPEFSYNPAGGNVVFDVSHTHVCPLCSFKKLVNTGGGESGAGENPMRTARCCSFAECHVRDVENKQDKQNDN